MTIYLNSILNIGKKNIPPTEALTQKHFKFLPVDQNDNFDFQCIMILLLLEKKIFLKNQVANNTLFRLLTLIVAKYFSYE